MTPSRRNAITLSVSECRPTPPDQAGRPRREDIDALYRQIEYLQKEKDRMFFKFKQAHDQLGSVLTKYTDYLNQSLESVFRPARYDSLTGLSNRHYFEDQARMLMRNAREETRQPVCLRIRVGRFDGVCKYLGSLMGDQVLIFVGGLVRMFAEEADLTARYENDEFVILKPDCDKEQAMLTATRMETIFAGHIEQILNRYMSASQVLMRLQERNTQTGVYSYPRQADTFRPAPQSPRSEEQSLCGCVKPALDIRISTPAAERTDLNERVNVNGYMFLQASA